MVDTLRTCARCGHRSGGCPRCGWVEPFLGGTVDGKPYCHTFSPGKPTCYELASKEAHSRKGPIMKCKCGARTLAGHVRKVAKGYSAHVYSGPHL